LAIDFGDGSEAGELPYLPGVFEHDKGMTKGRALCHFGEQVGETPTLLEA
jgi:hypothetical protein